MMKQSSSFESILHRAKNAFDPAIRHRGEGYFRAGWVSEPIFTDKAASFSVKGSKLYRVEVDWRRLIATGAMVVRCSCPHYDEGALCKHSWAALLKLNESGSARVIPSKAGMKVLHDYETDFDDDDFDDDDLDDDKSRRYRTAHSKTDPVKPWFRQLKSIQGEDERYWKSASGIRTGYPRNPRLGFYCLDLEGTEQTGSVTIEFYQQETLQSGATGAIKRARVSREELSAYTDLLDREIMTMLLGAATIARPTGYYGYYGESSGYAKISIPLALQEDLLKRMAKTGRFFGLTPYTDGQKTFLSFDDGEPWRLELSLKSERSHYVVEGFLRRGEAKVNLDEPLFCLRSGIVVFKDRLARLDAKHHFGWIEALRNEAFGPISKADGDEFVEAMCSDSNSPAIVWPEELKWKQELLEPKPKVIFAPPPPRSATRGLLVDLRFIYGDQEVSCLKATATLLDRANRRMLLRHFEKEKQLFEQLKSFEGLDPSPHEHREQFPLRVMHSRFAALANQILSWGWEVEAKGQRVKTADEFNIKVSSGVDWFELNGGAIFDGGMSLPLPALMAALERQEHLIPLGDGTLGMLPTEWLKKYAPLAQLGETQKEGIRFKRQQGVLLGAWLSDDKAAKADPGFSRLMREIKLGSKLLPREAPKTFVGKLRSYQKEGLGWLGFLGKVGFGGILADDMGLGKTVQLLAHLDAEYQRLKKTDKRPSLVILPKSLLFNWKEEASRFAPDLKVISYAGPERYGLLKEISTSDLVLVTYSTLRQDIKELRKSEFHYVIADEAQAIKNAKSLSHKACCLIRARHRLAMTGTPVENSVDDLFAILDFASPGLLGKTAREKMSSASAKNEIDTQALSELSRALKPFILRRTKDQVLKDLPKKTEKVVHCELSQPEMKRYTELRDYYRAHLKGEIERRGLARSKIVVLEALLRLRQAACHSGLVDKKLVNVESAKVETLTAQLKEVIAEGHKALVFSQFTSFMDIVGKALSREKIVFERLDGKTVLGERQDRVARFQTDHRIKVFLISLKAGGVGLNLTAADYVFILDPWWNPAVESQAIDRSHRIGQKNKVIAYRLIAKETVEEKILELQKSKRELASAIITADAGLLRKLTTEDIELLLS